MLIITLNPGVRWVTITGPDGRTVRLNRESMPAQGVVHAIRDGSGRVVGTIEGVDPRLDWTAGEMRSRVGIDLPREYRILRSNAPRYPEPRRPA